VNIRSLRFCLTAWYAGLLVCVVALFGTAVYFGLERYLEKTVRAALSEQARAVGEEINEQITENRFPSLVKHLNEKFAPHLNARFIRVTDASGTAVYLSKLSSDGLLDPSLVPRVHPEGEEYSTEVFLPNGKRVLVQVVPFSVSGKKYIIEAGSLYAPLEAVLDGLIAIFALGLPVLAAVAIGGGYFLMRRALIQVDEITIQAERISSDNLSARLPVPATGDELERLTLALNRMMSRLEDAFQHINRFSADVSHELRTPLTILRGELEALVHHEDLSPGLLDQIGSALEETERLRTIIDQLLVISRLDAGDVLQKVPLDLGRLALSTAEQMQVVAEEKSIKLSYSAEPGIQVEGDPSRLKQVVVNLLDNAIRYTSEGGSIFVSAGRRNGSAVLTVADNGTGIPPEALSHVFERFYRADKARSRYSGGAGLGLSIVNAICTAHRGEIEVSSAEGVGTTMTVLLPLAKN